VACATKSDLNRATIDLLMNSQKYTLAEFFCGCGGTSRGFTRSGRFNVAFGNDVKNEALRTFEFNHAHDDVPPSTVRKDIRLLEVDTIHGALKARGVGKGDLDVMIGGPPCQGFSQLRRNEHRDEGKIVKFSGYSQLAHDPRNGLVLRYLEVAEALRPKFLVIENVPQMLNHGFEGRLGKLSELVIQMLEKDLGYKVEVAVVNCADYGVPHPTEMRGITMREAARLQSFDDDFRFITSMSDDNETTRIGLGMDMIGEAVPPNLSQAIATHLASQLDTRASSSKKKNKT
jgi:site-specific DNA-cytosine methylase